MNSTECTVAPGPQIFCMFLAPDMPVDLPVMAGRKIKLAVIIVSM